MRKNIALVLTFACILSLCSCGWNSQKAVATVLNESNEKKETVKDDELGGVEKYTGYFLKTESQYFFISAQENDTFYKDEPVKISSPSWIEDTTVDFNGLSNGDKIEVEIFQIGDTEPRDMPVYGMELIEDVTLDNISNDVIQYLAELGYKVIED